MSRYRSDTIIRGGISRGTNQSIAKIRSAVKNNRIKLRFHVVKEHERLDSIAHRFLGDSKLWWVIAACSKIGWSLQVPPGTRLSIPINLDIINTII